MYLIMLCSFIWLRLLRSINSITEELPITENETGPVLVTQSSFAVAVKLVKPDEFSNNPFSISLGEDFNFGEQDQDIDSVAFQQTSSKPTASLSLPNNILTASGVSNVTRITQAVFLTDSLFLRRDNNYLEVGSIVLATEVVGTNVTGLSSPIELTFRRNPVSSVCAMSLHTPLYVICLYFFTCSELSKRHGSFVHILGL